MQHIIDSQERQPLLLASPLLLAKLASPLRRSGAGDAGKAGLLLVCCWPSPGQVLGQTAGVKLSDPQQEVARRNQTSSLSLSLLLLESII